MSYKRGPWDEKCGNCKHYKDGECTLLSIKIGYKDWCDSWEKADKRKYGRKNR